MTKKSTDPYEVWRKHALPDLPFAKIKEGTFAELAAGTMTQHWAAFDAWFDQHPTVVQQEDADDVEEERP